MISPSILVTPQQFIAAARASVGTPFRHEARLPGVGLDCIGVAVCAAIACGLVHRDIKAYPLRPNGQLIRELDAQLVLVAQRSMEGARPGDILAMQFEGTPHHIAIYTGATIIHAYIAAHKCVEQPMVDYWRSMVQRVYRFREFIG